MPGTSAMSSPPAARRRGRGARPLRRRRGPRSLGGRRDPDGRRPALARRLELGLRLPARPRPQAPRDARSVVRRPAGWPATPDADRPPPGRSDRRDRTDHRGDRRRRVAARVPRPPARPRRRLHGRGGRRTPALHPVAARDRRPGHQLTASEKAVSDPQWSPDGRRLAFVRDDEIWVVEADGSRLTRVVAKPGGGREPRWSPDGRRLAFLSRRRGWSQVWLIDAPVPRRGRPAARPAPAGGDRADTEPGIDVDGIAWSPGRQPARGHGPAAARRPRDRADRDRRRRHRRRAEVVAGERSHDTGAPWLPDGSLLYVSDADGWFQVVRRSADGRDRIVLTDGEREHGEPSGGVGYAPLPSPDGSRGRPHRGPRRAHRPGRARASPTARRPSAVAAGRRRRRGPSRPPRRPSGSRRGTASGGRSAGCPTAPGSRPSGRARPARRTCGCCPSPASRPTARGRARSPTRRPAVLASALAPGRVAAGERIAITARDGLRVEGTLWRPSDATGKRGGQRVPTIIYPHGGPTWQSFRGFQPFKLLLAREGFAFLDVDFRGSTGYGRAFRQANHDEWGHADVHDLIDAGALGAGAAVVGRPARDLRRVVRRLHGPVRPRRGARDVARPGSTCTATPRSPRASATATGPAASTSSG